LSTVLWWVVVVLLVNPNQPLLELLVVQLCCSVSVL
jgi:hypothetical protein